MPLTIVPAMLARALIMNLHPPLALFLVLLNFLTLAMWAHPSGPFPDL